MKSGDLYAILPLIIPAAAIILLLLLTAIARSHLLVWIVTTLSLVIALASVILFHKPQTQQVTQLIIVDGYSYFYTALIYAATLIICIQSYLYIKNTSTVREEYYILLLTAALGSAVLVSSSHFVSLFIGLELLSLSLYSLIAYTGSGIGIEAGIKYFVLTAVSTAFLLFGGSLVYCTFGTMNFAKAIYNSNTINSILFLSGLVMILTGIFFKLALFPFNLWAPDVFQGAPAPVTGFLATVSKGAVFAAIMRFFNGFDITSHNSLFYILAGIATASMFFGNITALLQNNIKRILAYSSISHFGYLLITVIAGGTTGLAASLFYLAAYFITTLTAFSVITFLSSDESEFENIEDYRGLAFRHPLFSAGLTVAMLSLAGIPLTAGFIAKFYLITAGAKMQLWILLVILVINSVIGLFYYLRVAVYLYLPPATERAPEKASYELSYSWMGGVTFVILLISLFYTGILPGNIIHLIISITDSLK